MTLRRETCLTPNCARFLRALGICYLVTSYHSTSAQQTYVPQPATPAYAQPTGVPSLNVGQLAAVSSVPGSQAQIAMVDDRIQFSCPVNTRGQLDYSTKSKLQITIEVTAAYQYGYQPIRLMARSQQPVAADRGLVIRFHAGSWGNRNRSIVLEQRLTILKGQSEASVRAYVPQYQDWQICGWSTAVDDAADDELSVEQLPFSQQQPGYGVSAMIIGDGPSAWRGQAALQVLANVGSPHVRKLDELPATWLEYSGFDVVMLTANILERIGHGDRQRIEALTRWVRSGGNLWVVDCGRNWQKLLAVENTLGYRESATTATPANGDNVNAEILRRGWRFAPLNERAFDPIEGALLISGYDLGEPPVKAAKPGQPFTTTQQLLQAIISVANHREVTSEKTFAVRELGLGAVAAFRADSDQLTSADATLAVQQSLLAPRLTMVGRFGNKPDEANGEFNNWLIPGVGVAPVGMFQFLISLFVLAIGPLNYWWLSRRKKLPLLLATVPAASAVATLLLLCYGTLADGLGTRARARSLTCLDQRAGEATTWARLSYFAGVRPRDGFSLPTDVAVYPILSDWSVGRYGNALEIERAITWGKTQQLSSGWLPSRTPMQYLSISARASKKRLEITPVAEGLQVDNRLGANVTHLVIQDRGGKLHWLEDLRAGQRKIAPPAEVLSVSGKIRQLFADHYPEYPPGAEPSLYSGGYAGAAMAQGLLEAHLEAINSPLVERWIDGSYIAVTDVGVELELGLNDVREEASFHVIRGLW